MFIKKIIFHNFIIFFAYLVFYQVSMFLFDLDILYGNLIFLPHSIRLIAAIVFGWWVLPGLFIAHLVSSLIAGHAIDSHSLLISTNASLCGYFAVFLITFFKVKNFNHLININFSQVLFVVLFAGIFNSIGDFLIKDYFFDNIISINFIFSYIIGDFIGGFIGLYILLKLLPKNLIKSIYS